jgi:hypothetical protein
MHGFAIVPFALACDTSSGTSLRKFKGIYRASLVSSASLVLEEVCWGTRLFELDFLKRFNHTAFELLNPLGNKGVLSLALQVKVDHRHVFSFPTVLLEKVILQLGELLLCFLFLLHDSSRTCRHIVIRVVVLIWVRSVV